MANTHDACINLFGGLVMNISTSFLAYLHLSDYIRIFSVAKATLESQMSVHLYIHLSQKPLSISESSYQAYLLSSISPINHRAYQPSSLSTIKPINH